MTFFHWLVATEGVPSNNNNSYSDKQWNTLGNGNGNNNNNYKCFMYKSISSFLGVSGLHVFPRFHGWNSFESHK